MLREVHDIVVYGVGGLGRGAHQVIADMNTEGDRPLWNMVGWLDDDPAKRGTIVHGRRVLGDASWLEDHPDTDVVVGIGSPGARRRIVEAIRARGHRRFATLVHPAAWIADRARIAEGSIVMAGATVNTDATVGRFVVLNMNCTVGHDATLADFATVSPGFNVSGNVRIGEGAVLGAGGSILQGKRVGAWSTVGAGGVVTSYVQPDTTVVGVPAKPIEERSERAARQDDLLGYRGRT